MTTAEIFALVVAIFAVISIGVTGWILGRLQGYRIGQAETEWRLMRRLHLDELRPRDDAEQVTRRPLWPDERKPK